MNYSVLGSSFVRAHCLRAETCTPTGLMGGRRLCAIAGDLTYPALIAYVCRIVAELNP